VGSFIMKATRY